MCGILMCGISIPIDCWRMLHAGVGHARGMGAIPLHSQVQGPCRAWERTSFRVCCLRSTVMAWERASSAAATSCFSSSCTAFSLSCTSCTFLQAPLPHD